MQCAVAQFDKATIPRINWSDDRDLYHNHELVGRYWFGIQYPHCSSIGLAEGFGMLGSIGFSGNSRLDPTIYKESNYSANEKNQAKDHVVAFALAWQVTLLWDYNRFFYVGLVTDYSD